MATSSGGGREGVGGGGVAIVCVRTCELALSLVGCLRYSIPVYWMLLMVLVTMKHVQPKVDTFILYRRHPPPVGVRMWIIYSVMRSGVGRFCVDLSDLAPVLGQYFSPVHGRELGSLRQLLAAARFFARADCLGDAAVHNLRRPDIIQNVGESRRFCRHVPGARKSREHVRLAP